MNDEFHYEEWLNNGCPRRHCRSKEGVGKEQCDYMYTPGVKEEPERHGNRHANNAIREWRTLIAIRGWHQW